MACLLLWSLVWIVRGWADRRGPGVSGPLRLGSGQPVTAHVPRPEELEVTPSKKTYAPDTLVPASRPEKFQIPPAVALFNALW